jgi:hypothetical protein
LDEELGTLGVTKLNENLDEAEFGLQAEKGSESEDLPEQSDVAEGETDATVENVSALDGFPPQQLNQPASTLPGLNQTPTPLVVSVEEVLQPEGGLALEQVEAQRQEDLQSTLPGVDPPPGSPNALSPAALQQVLNEASEAVRSGAAGGADGQGGGQQ